MNKVLLNLIKTGIEILGVIADVLALFDHLPYINQGLSQQHPPIDSITSLLLIIFGLTAVGVLFWAWLEPRASTPFEGIRLFFFVQLFCAGGMLYLHIKTFGGSINLTNIGILIIIVIASEYLSRQIYKFFTLPKYS